MGYDEKLTIDEHLQNMAFESVGVHLHGKDISLHAIFKYDDKYFASSFFMDPNTADSLAKALVSTATEVRQGSLMPPALEERH